MRPIATTTSDFADLRKDGCIYVDKTAYFHRLISTVGTKLYFLARPRRFGKSLMITALKEIFLGRRELFDGLAIADTDWDWSQKWPVLHFEFADVDATSLETFERSFASNVKTRLQRAGYSYDDSKLPSDNFGNAIDELSAANDGNGTVVLIDEYDAPVSHALDDIALANAIRDRMSAFYSQMKTRTGAIRFLMMTGVSKFTKMSVFSTLNNIVDVSQDDEYALMLGYTEEELTANFDEHLRAHAEKMGKPYDEYRAEMKRWYNGFRFAKSDPTTVYNPISVALTLYKKERSFSATWSSTGRASTLMKSLKRWDMLAIDPDATRRVTERAFDVTDLANLKPIGMLYQTGYLTIKDYADGLYTLGVPDEEVRQDLNLLMAGVAADKDVEWAADLGARLICCEWDDFFVGLKALYAAMAYGTTEVRVHENSYGRCLAFLLASCGFRFTMEDVQANGRADVVANHAVGTFIFELKVDEPVDKAFAQIRTKNYAAPYLASGKPIWLIGLSFDSETRHLVDCAAEHL
ncbi:MAG: AAA family ATPase [Kiritimatiellae bacterium]|nr:AAA family ATPase [Kiritimatiellia bacterium]